MGSQRRFPVTKLPRAFSTKQLLRPKECLSERKLSWAPPEIPVHRVDVISSVAEAFESLSRSGRSSHPEMAAPPRSLRARTRRLNISLSLPAPVLDLACVVPPDRVRRARPLCFRAVKLLPPRIELLKGDPKFVRDFHRRPTGCFSEMNSFTFAFVADFLNRVLHLTSCRLTPARALFVRWRIARAFVPFELLPPGIELLKGDPEFARDFHRRPVGCFSEANSFALALLADFLK